MLNIQNLGQLAADETSVRASRQRHTTVTPRGRYDFGDGELFPGGGTSITIQPMPVKSRVQVHSAAVQPDSLPGSGLPKDSVVMPTGKMAGLGDALCPVPVPFRVGIEPEHKAHLLRPGADIRRVGGQLRRMAPHAHHVERDPITRDGAVLNASASTHVRAGGFAPDDRIRQRLAPATQPTQAAKVSQVVARTPMARAATTLAPTTRYAAHTAPQHTAPMRAPERRYVAATRPQTASRSLRGDGGTMGGPVLLPAGSIRAFSPLVPLMTTSPTMHILPQSSPRLPSGSPGADPSTAPPACPEGTTPLPDGSGCACNAGLVPNADGTACVAAQGSGDAAHGPSGGVNPLVWVGLLALAGGVYWMTQEH